MFPGLFHPRPSPGQLRIAGAVRDQVLAVSVILGLFLLLGFVFTKVYLRRRTWTSGQFKLYAAGVMGAVCFFGVFAGMIYPVVHASRSIRIDSTHIERGFPLPWWVKTVPHYGWPGFIDVPQYSFRSSNLIIDIFFWLATGIVMVWVGVILRLRLRSEMKILVKTK